ncbi:MAG TPA: DinB family protein, partial [Longimicrobium sp.]|nr:DinB family protein [Longimicrobium sp.]
MSTVLGSADLVRFGRELDSVRRQADALTRDVTPEQARWSAGPGRWSTLQVINHLRITNDLYMEAIRHSIDAARAAGHTGADSYRPGWLGGWMTKSMEPPVRRRFKSPALFAPREGELPEWSSELAGYLATHALLDERLRAADGIKLSRARVASPVNKLIRVNLGDAIAIVLAHERRHLWQLRGIRSDPEFPAP